MMRVAWPLIVNYLAVAGINFSDAVMAGRLGARELAAVAVGGSVWMLGFSLCLGILMAISPIVSRFFGAGELGSIGRYVRQGIWLSQVLGLLIFAAAQLWIDPVLVYIGIDPEFRDLTVGYVRAIAFGLPAISLFLVFRFTSEAIGFTRPVMYMSLISLAVNVLGNYVLMFGKFGAPALGAIGCGISSAISMCVVAGGLVTIAIVHPRYRPLGIFTRIAPLRLSIFREMLGLGVPIAITITAETGLFSAISILVGTLGTTIAAAHQIAINFASTMFMIPLALSSAITVRIGHELGAGRPVEARYAGSTGLLMCAIFMSVSAVVLLLFKESVVSLYTNDESVRAIAISLLFMAAIFQVADGLQIGAAAALRGYKDTRVPMAVNLFAYWVLAFPLAYLSAVTFRLHPQYIWGAFVLGLSVAATILTLRFLLVSRRAITEQRSIPAN